MRTSSTGNRGFTLVEMIVVVVIVSVLTAMIVPQMYRARGWGLRQSARRLLVTAQYAREFAATRRYTCRLIIDREEQQYSLAQQKDPEGDPNEFVPLKVSLGKTERLGEGLRFGRIRIEPQKGRGERGEKAEQANYISFEPSGQADAAVLEITDGEGTCSVLVMPHTGYARLIEGVSDELPNDRLDLDEW